MNFFTKAANGWDIAVNSYKVLQQNKKLLLFPLLSGISLLLIIISLVVAALGLNQWDIAKIDTSNIIVDYAFVFLYYLFNYFVIVFFNTALTHCVTLYFKGEEVSVKAGIAFSVAHIGSVFSWAVFAATVGTILQVLQENLGIVGKIITGLVGIVFNVASFFIIPVMVYENLGPVDAFKRSASLIKEKWANAAGASFNFGFVQFIAVIFLAIIAYTIGIIIHPLAGVAIAVLGILLLIAVISAAKTIFTIAVYKDVTGDPVAQYEQHFIDNLFIQK